MTTPRKFDKTLYKEITKDMRKKEKQQKICILIRLVEGRQASIILY
jgi:hypothetical protein